MRERKKKREKERERDRQKSRQTERETETEKELYPSKNSDLVYLEVKKNVSSDL